MLREFSLRRCRDRDVLRSILPKHNGAGGCGALIDGQHKGHDGFPGVCLAGYFGWAEASGLGSGRQYRPMSTSLFTSPRLRGEGEAEGLGWSVLRASPTPWRDR